VEPIAQLEVLDPRAGAGVAGRLAAAGAVSAGLGPLAADRARRGVANAVAEAPGPVTLTARNDTGAVVLELRGCGGGWPARAGRLLDGLGACTVRADGVDVRLAAPPLRGRPAD
jgi:hypothetical protein